MPLFDPDRLLTRFKPVTDFFVSLPALVIWSCCVAAGLALGVINFEALTENVADRVLGMENMVLLWFVYPFVKLIHEIGHACTVKRWNGEVHDVGIMFLVLMPIPYVDASAAIPFADKRKRIIVDAAGIMVELFLASVALFFWLNLAPGPARSVCFNIMIIAGISTLLFNGNPLFKFDAYYILSDALEIPNLATKSSQYIGYLIKRYLLRIRQTRSPATGIKESIWLGTYAVLSFFYKIYISLRISLFVAGKFFFIGVILALWAGINMVVVPIVNLGKKIMTDIELKDRRLAAIGLILAGSAAVWFLVFRFPFPYATVAEGVTQIQEEGVVYAAADGFLKELTRQPGSMVKQGEQLFELANPDYDTQLQLNRTRQAEYRFRLTKTGITNTTQYNIIKDEILWLGKEEARILEKKAGLVAVSPVDGQFFIPDNTGFLGTHYRQGMAVGYVVDLSRATVVVVIHQAYADLVRQRTRRVELRFSSDIDSMAPGTILRELPAASNALPNMALSLEGGGGIALDPGQVNAPKTFEKYFQFEIGVDPAHMQRIGERVFVKFIYEPEPLFFRLKRYIRRLFMSRFDI